MTTGLTVDYVKHQSWALMVKQQSESGLSVAQWCEENNLKTKCFYYRKRRVREELLNNSPAFAELRKPIDAYEGTALNAKVIFTPQLTLDVCGVTIGVSDATPSSLLMDVLQVVRNA